MSFFQNLGLAYGNSLLVGQEMDDKQANIDLKQQQVAQYKMSNAAKAQEVATNKQIGDFIATETGRDSATVSDPTKAATLYQRASTMALQGGSWEKAKELNELGKSSADQAKAATAAVEAKAHASREALSTAALNFQAFPTSEGADTIARAAVAAGVNPTTIPLPNSPEFPMWVRSQQTVAQTSKERTAGMEKVREFDILEKRRVDEQADRREDRRLSREERALSREGLETYRNESLDSRKAALVDAKSRKASANDFQQTEKLINTAQAQAAPYLKDREVLTSVKNLLSVDSAVADQQVQQALPSLLGSLKGRATNPYYKDNKYYGSLVDKLFDASSRATSGRYSEETRQQIYSMLDMMEKQNIDPALTRIEAAQKEHGKTAYGLDPDNINLRGEFNRLGSDGKPVVKKEAAAPVSSNPSETDTPAKQRNRSLSDVQALKNEIRAAKGDRNMLDILEPELRRAEAQEAKTRTPAPAAAPTPAPAAPASGQQGVTRTWGLPEGVTQAKTINGVTYHQKGKEWLPVQ